MTIESSPVSKDDPRMVAWNAYKETGEYANSKHWALTIQPIVYVGDPAGDRQRYSLMPIEQRERYVEGSLWAAFIAGFEAGLQP